MVKFRRTEPLFVDETVREERKPGIAKGRNRMEQTQVEGFAYWIRSPPVEKKERRAGEFDRGGKNENRSQQIVNVLARRVRKDFLHGHPVLEKHSFTDYLKECDRNGHDPQPTQLDHRQDDTLSKVAEITAGVDDDQPRDADSGSRREKGVDGADRSRNRGGRQHQQAGPHGYGRQVAEQQQIGRMKCAQLSQGPFQHIRRASLTR